MMSTSPSGKRGRTRWPIAVAAGTALLLSGCGVADSESPGSSADTVRIVLPIEPTTLEACDSTLSSTGVVIRSNVTEPLIERNPTTGELDPLLATSWEATGETDWTFTLRDDVKFHDGTSFTAEAAAFAIDRAVNLDLGCDVEGQMFGDPNLTLTVVDVTTLVVTTESPDPVLPLRLSFIEIGAPTDAGAKVREPVGTGPYSIKEWKTGINIVLALNNDYWGETPAYKSAEYQWRSEGTVRAAMVSGGEADLALSLSADDGAGDLGLSYPNNETVALRFSGDIAPLNDIRVRQAINFAIDRDGITGSLYEGASEPADQLVPPGVVGYNPSIKPWEYDLDRAKQLIAAARADGVPVDDKITIVARSDQFPKIAQMTEVLQEQLGQAGLNIEVKVAETSVGLQYQVRPFILNEGAIAMLIQHGNQAGDASFSVESYMTTGAAMSMFGTSTFDTLLADAAATTGEARQAAFADALAYEKEELVQFAYIARMSGVIGKSPSVDFEPNSLSGDELRLAEITRAGATGSAP
ncbi:ABC transporter substrate-binding protein [Cryobacterium luteum]|nr:ABC transporter substrate-binding protein [Cryobacterium luteum]SEM87504.1 peptide/nickel transport system substrate-binding protein [Cryobacterium luteum]